MRNGHWIAMTTVCALLGQAAAQTTIHVATCGDDSWSGLSDVCQAPDGPKATIQAGIDAASAGDTVLVHGGVYSGPGNRAVTFDGKAITVASAEGPDATVVHVDAFDTPAFSFIGGSGARLQGITIRNAAFTFSSQQAAITIAGADPTIVDCVVEDCSRSFDCFLESGAVMVGNGATPVFEDCVFRRNEVEAGSCGGIDEGRGGAVFVGSSSATFVRCLFDDNTSRFGGAIAMFGDESSEVRIEGCTFMDNIAIYGDPDDSTGGLGGAIFCRGGGRVVATDCVFVGNVAEGGPDGAGSGGAIWVLDSDGFSLSACVFTGNASLRAGDGRGGRGGAISAARSGPLTLVNCAFLGNVADGDGEGAAASLSGAGISLVGCTISGNDGGIAPALWVSSGAVENCILYENSAKGIDGSVNARYSDVEGGYVGEGNIDADPLFADPANGDYRLSPGSPCIDAGDNLAVPLSAFEDLAGEERFRDDPATADTGIGVARVVDMGAYEYQPGPYCYADFNDDGTPNIIDFIDFLNAWNRREPTTNLYPDDTIDTRDVSAYLNFWNSGC